MTRIEYVLDGFSKISQAITAKDIIKNFCPGYFSWTEPKMDPHTTAIRRSQTGEIIGCRGITCKECWNQEITKEFEEYPCIRI